MERTFYQSESLGSSATTSTSYQDKCTLTFTPGDNETWLLLTTWLFTSNSITYSGYAKLVRTSGTPANFDEIRHYQENYVSSGCFGYETFGSSPGAQTYKVQFKAQSGVQSVNIANVRMIAIRLESNDKFAQSLSIDAYKTDLNYQDKVALTFTPDSAGDYLILASCAFNGDNIAQAGKVRIDVDGTSQYDTTTVYPQTYEGVNAALRAWGSVKKLTLTQASHTIKIQYATTSTLNYVRIGYAYIIALRVSDFPAFYYGEDESRTTTSTASYQDKLTLAQDLLAADHIILSSFGTDLSSSVHLVYSQLLQDSSSLGEMIYTPGSYTGRHSPYLIAVFISTANQSYTWKVQWMPEPGYTAGVQDARIAILRLDVSTALPIVTTSAITNITQNSATGNGNVISNGGGTITERGFCWSTSVNPTTSDNKVIVSGTLGEFSGSLTGLTPYTVYHVRGYATTEAGTGYGEDRSFTTLSLVYTEFEEIEERILSKPIVIVTLGSYEVPQYDIMDLDQLVLSRSDDFSVVTSDITITLNNNTGKYSPGKSNFIWAGESWYHQSFKLEFTYQDITEKITLFEGYITKWNQKETKDAAYDSPIDGQFVEITAEDHCSMLEDRIIGQPDDDGTINPFVHGRIFKQSETLDAKTFWTANDDIDFETGDLTQVDSTVGTVTIETVDPYAGTYCAKFVSNTGSDCGYCIQDVLPTGGYEFHISAYFKMETIPDPAYQNNIRFMAIHDQINNELISVTMDRKDTNQYILALSILGADFQQTSIDLSDYQNIWVKMDLLVRNDVTNNMMLTRLFFNDDDVASITSLAYVASVFRYAIFGAKLMYTFTTPWVLYVDNVKIYTVAYPLGYYLPGGVYQSINSVYVDGSFWPKKNKSVWVPYWNDNSWKFNYISYYGKGSTPENYRTNLTYCLVDFTDYNNQPSGSVLIDATKDSIEHPVDQIEEILTEVDLDSRIDATNFALAKAMNSNDTTGIYIDNQSAADAITSICQNTMNSFVERQGYFGILPFTGEHKTDYVKTLNNSNCHSIEEATDMDNLQTQIDVVWGWYDKNKKLFYRVKNDGMISMVGNQSTKLDLSYGQDVSTNNGDMAKAKARLLLNRYSGPIDEVIIKGNLALIRIEIGDGVLIESDLNDSYLIYEVIEKSIDFNEKTVELKVHRYNGNNLIASFSGTSTINPFVVLDGSATVTPTIASSIGETFIDAIIADVNYAYLPKYIKARGSVLNPTFIYGNINFTPTQAEGIGESIDPTVAIS